MSRKAHKVSKLMPGKPLIDIVHLAQYGDLYNEQAFWLANVVHHAAYLETIEGRLPKERRYMVSYHRGIAWRFLSKAILEAWKKGDGAIFRSMADAVELEHKPIDPIRAFVATQFGTAEAFDLPTPTIRKLRASLIGLAFPKDQISDRQLRRIVMDYLKRVPGRAPRGGSRKAKA